MADDLTSRLEIARDQIKDEFARITTNNGFRTDVVDVVNAIRPFESIGQPPEIGIVFLGYEIRGIDQMWQAFDLFADVLVQGVVTANTSDTKDGQLLNTKVAALAQDVSRVMAIIMTKYVAGTEYRWNILPQPIKIFTEVDFGEQKNTGIVYCGFQVQLRALDGAML